MKKLTFSSTITAPAQKVWQIMLSKQTYNDWASAFDPSSTFQGSWQEGAEIKFVGMDDQGKQAGMVGMVDKYQPYEFVSIRYTGIIVNSEVDRTSQGAQQWIGAYETYHFKEENSVTNLTVTIDVIDDMADIFEEMWPKALEKLKNLVESN